MTESAPELPADVRASFLEVVRDDSADEAAIAAASAAVLPTGRQRVELADGHHVILRDPKEFRAKHREQLFLGVSRDDEIAAGFQFVKKLAAVAIESWSLPYPIPSQDIASLGELTIEQEDQLRDAVMPYAEFFRSTSRAATPSADPSSPTGPSAG